MREIARCFVFSALKMVQTNELNEQKLKSTTKMKGDSRRKHF